MRIKYKNVVFAGTFDHLHKGHLGLIDKAFSISKRVSLGITTDKFIRKKFLSEKIESFVLRKKQLRGYLLSQKYLSRVDFFPLSDVYGPAILANSFDSILVTKQTLSNAEKINEMRKKKKLRQLKIVVADFIKADDGEIITSEKVRTGEVDREGRSFAKIFKDKKILKLPQNLRESLRKPLGEVIEGDEHRLDIAARKTFQCIKTLKSTMTIAVGDIVTMSLLQVGFDPDIKIIDLRSRRKSLKFPKQNFFGEELTGPVSNSLPPVLARQSNTKVSLRAVGALSSQHPSTQNYINEPGTINSQTVLALKSSIDNYLNKQKKQLIVIKGEEDLLALPAILLAPLDSLVLYGQMDLGIVAVKVTEKRKKEVMRILTKFNS